MKTRGHPVTTSRWSSWPCKVLERTFGQFIFIVLNYKMLFNVELTAKGGRGYVIQTEFFTLNDWRVNLGKNYNNDIKCQYICTMGEYPSKFLSLSCLSNLVRTRAWESCAKVPFGNEKIFSLIMPYLPYIEQKYR